MSGRGTGSSRSASCSTRCAAKISLTFPGCLLNESFHIRNESTTKSSILRQICVNGSDQHPLFTWLKRQLPAPIDDADSLMSDPKFIQWSPVCRFVSFFYRNKLFSRFRQIQFLKASDVPLPVEKTIIPITKTLLDLTVSQFW